MTIGDKIKKIRTFRNMTQAELGAALGWGDKGANRLAQYETNYRVPRKDLVTEMAKILDENHSYHIADLIFITIGYYCVNYAVFAVTFA